MKTEWCKNILRTMKSTQDQLTGSGAKWQREANELKSSHSIRSMINSLGSFDFYYSMPKLTPSPSREEAFTRYFSLLNPTSAPPIFLSASPSANPSLIDSIVAQHENVHPFEQDYVTRTIIDGAKCLAIASLKPPLRNKVQTIRDFFSGNKAQGGFRVNELSRETYSSLLLGVKRTENATDNKPYTQNSTYEYSLSEDVFDNPEDHPISKKESNIYGIIKSFQAAKQNTKSPQYLQIVRGHLEVLLNYIVKDQGQYKLLSFDEKMSVILNNLDEFKGKFVQGQSKEELLNIFFQEYEQYVATRTAQMRKTFQIPEQRSPQSQKLKGNSKLKESKLKNSKLRAWRI